MIKWRLGAALLMSAAVLTGCDDDDDDPPVEPIPETGIVRVVNASGATPSIDVTVDDEAGVSNLAFSQASNDLELDEGDRVLAVTVSGGAAASFDSTVTVVADEEQTFLVVGGADALEALVLDDDLTAPTAGNFRARIVHASPTAGAVDVYVTAPDADLTAETPVLANVGYKSFDVLDELPAGDYVVSVVAAGSTDPVVATSGTLTIADGAIHTIVVADDPEAETPTVTVFALTDN